MSLTVAFHTARTRPKFDWFFDSLAKQKGVQRVTQILIVDFYAQACDEWTENDVTRRRLEIVAAAKRAGLDKLVEIHPPKPNIWGGPHRVTKENWWHVAAVRNTSFCLCRNEWIVCLDDRCVLQPQYIQAVKRAVGYKYFVAGSYQKRTGMVVENGVITKEGDITGVDNREEMAKGRILKVNGAWSYGCSFAVPIEWVLAINGVSELCDGMSFEDICGFGMLLHNNGFPMRYDPNMRVIQDRTPSELDKPFKRSDKGVSPNDKSHASLQVIGGKKRSEHEWDLRQIRKDVLAGKPFPIPTNTNPVDWYDGQPIREL